MKKEQWEYGVWYLAFGADRADFLNRRASEGWELVCVYDNSFYLKRPLVDPHLDSHSPQPLPVVADVP